VFETATFLLILALIVVNHRREVWKFRAQWRKAEVDVLMKNLETEQDANAHLTKLLPKGSVVYRQSSWPDTLEDE
jgi:ribonucleotide reductase alpha subunit